MLTAFTFENYRAFVDPTTIELRPLTLLFGYNNSGKSALVRGLALLADSARADAKMPLDLTSEAARDCTFDDLRSKLGGSDTLRFQLSFDNDALRVEWSVTEPKGLFRQIVTEFKVTATPATSLVLEWAPSRSETPTYAVLIDGERTNITVRSKLTSLVPGDPDEIDGDPRNEAAKAVYQRVIGILRKNMSELSRQVQWLGSIRQCPPRSETYRGEALPRLGHDGTGTALSLIRDKVTEGPLLREISAWYEDKATFKRKLEVIQSSDNRSSLTLEPLVMGEGRQINVADTGEGMAQVMPVLLAAAMARRGGDDDPTILAIEQPELHLHPKVHEPLVRYLSNLVANTDTPPRMLIETHSENILLGIQIQIVKRELPTDRVLVYWVRQLDDGTSYVQRIEFDEEGFPVGFPDDVFNEDLELARVLLELREHAAK